MGQSDILAWLKDNTGWHNVREISVGVGISHRNVQRCLTRAAASGDVARIRGEAGCFLYSLPTIYINRDLHNVSLRSSNREEMQEAGQIST